MPNMLLKYHRQLRGWSQRRLAEQIATDSKRVSEWECGRIPSPFYRERLCVLFDKNAVELGFISELVKA